MSPRRSSLVVGLDCDGVLGDFVEPALRAIELYGGPRVAPEQLRHYDFQNEYLEGEARAAWTNHVFGEGFCYSLPEFPGARACVDRLRQVAEVVCVTSPPTYGKVEGKRWLTWSSERYAWLIERFGFKKDQIVFGSGKWHVDADYLADDCVDQVRNWVEYRKTRRPVWQPIFGGLVARPYNGPDGFPALPEAWRTLHRDAARMTLERFVAQVEAGAAARDGYRP